MNLQASPLIVSVRFICAAWTADDKRYVDEFIFFGQPSRKSMLAAAFRQ